ncbi:MAG: response regulator [Chitinophagaceae bacterium]|nr:response regulator [Chitinophagaceae bacterium]
MRSCIIIDDENKARLLLRNMLADVAPDIQVLADCDDLPSGVKAIKKLKPELVFLDIEMPGHSGLEILDFFNEEEINFDIVFVTGYSEYAIQAFKLSAIDYLLKPLNPDQLQQTINKLDRKDGRQKQQEYKALQHNIAYNQDVQDKCIIVNLSNSTRFIKVKDIVYLSAEGSYCNLFLKNQEKLLASKNLKYFEERLTDFPQFFRCHKSYIINLKEVKEYNKSEQTIFLDFKQTALLSADKSDIFMSKMEALN